MNVILAEHAGFCLGVRSAVEKAENLAETKSGVIYTLGHLIHNETVVEELREKNIIPIEPEELSRVSPSDIIIRAHGIGRKLEEEIKALGFTVTDATCPHVKKIHREVLNHSRQGEHVIIIGDPNHPEVIGIKGWVEGDDSTIIENTLDAEKFLILLKKPIFIVVQTTFNHKLFKEIVEIICKKGYDVNTLDSICPATYERQREAGMIASKVGAMIVIGGRNSSNTKKLYDICKSKCDNTFFLQTKSDLDFTVLQTIDNVGITAGASTPDKLIREVMLECQK